MGTIVEFSSARQHHSMEALVDTFQQNTNSYHPLYQIYHLLTENVEDGNDDRDAFYRQYLHGIVPEDRPLTAFEKQYAVSLHLLMFARLVRKQSY